MSPLSLSLKCLFIFTRLTHHLLEYCSDQCFAYQVNFCWRFWCFYLWMFTVTNFLDGDKNQCDNAFSWQLITTIPPRAITWTPNAFNYIWLNQWMNIHVFFHSNVKTVGDYWFICYIYKKKNPKQNKQTASRSQWQKISLSIQMNSLVLNIDWCNIINPTKEAEE